MVTLRQSRQQKGIVWLVVGVSLSSLIYSMTSTTVMSRNTQDFMKTLVASTFTFTNNGGETVMNETKLQDMLRSSTKQSNNRNASNGDPSAHDDTMMMMSYSSHNEASSRRHQVQDTSSRKQQKHQSHSHNSTSHNSTTLALLYPTGLIGGYRNQAMRFVAFVKHAIDQNITQILLPSLLWSTRYSNQRDNFFWPVPFQDLFDVEHWNTFSFSTQPLSSSLNTAIPDISNSTPFLHTIKLPLLVDSVPNADCWRHDPLSKSESERIRQTLFGNDYVTAVNRTTQTSPTIPIRNGHWFIPKLTEHVVTTSATRLTPTANATVDYLAGNLGTAIRKLNFKDAVQHCQHPQVYGGGTHAGVLWNRYLSMSHLQPGNDVHNAKPNTVRTANMVATMHRALIPALQWRTLADRCVQHHLTVNDSVNNQRQAARDTMGYVVLHARVETEMMVHKCGRDMEKNLTTLFDRVDDFIDRYNEQQLPPNRRLHGTMVAVGREGMQEQSSKVADLVAHNWKTLNERSISYINGKYTLVVQHSTETNVNGTTSTAHKLRPRQKQSLVRQITSQLPMFECGEGWVEEAFYNDPVLNEENLPHNYYGDVLPSVVNFWLAVEADVFIGVMKSSWSTDVWTARYYLGKGRHNFQHTSDNGIIPVSHGGLPPSHKNC
ncbi:hypothetical protein IV203_028529 [Nitzschia inconspicua]|uniref:Uncharacterized protein n=1 Tax=Nitzschia inconspicua TaxID=303405 RepID=A0A9K3LQ18_9STRA|nr:hypothetical protein IV203_028529 [Nitzschia inconspicua]